MCVCAPTRENADGIVRRVLPPHRVTLARPSFLTLISRESAPIHSLSFLGPSWPVPYGFIPLQGFVVQTSPESSSFPIFGLRKFAFREPEVTLTLLGGECAGIGRSFLIAAGSVFLLGGHLRSPPAVCITGGHPRSPPGVSERRAREGSV